MPESPFDDAKKAIEKKPEVKLFPYQIRALQEMRRRAGAAGVLLSPYCLSRLGLKIDDAGYTKADGYVDRHST